MTASGIIQRIESQRNEQQRRVLIGFFKTGKGDYGEGDELLGLKVPQTRAIVKTVAAETPEFKKYVAEIEACGQMKLERFEF